MPVRASLSAWESASQLADSAARKRYLVQCLGDDSVPLQAQVAGIRKGVDAAVAHSLAPDWKHLEEATNAK